MINANAQLVYKSYRKSKLAAYLLWLCFSSIGAHRFYVKRKSAWAFVALFVGGLFTYGVAWFALLIWVAIDFFLIPSLVEEYNDGLKGRIISPSQNWL